MGAVDIALTCRNMFCIRSDCRKSLTPFHLGFLHSPTGLCNDTSKAGNSAGRNGGRQSFFAARALLSAFGFSTSASVEHIRRRGFPAGGKTLEMIMQKLKREAAYFAPMDGKRSGLIFFNLDQPSQIIEACEPLFSGLNAAVELIPVMNGDDLRKGLAKVSAD